MIWYIIWYTSHKSYYYMIWFGAWCVLDTGRAASGVTRWQKTSEPRPTGFRFSGCRWKRGWEKDTQQTTQLHLPTSIINYIHLRNLCIIKHILHHLITKMISITKKQTANQTPAFARPGRTCNFANSITLSYLWACIISYIYIYMYVYIYIYMYTFIYTYFIFS